MTEADLWNELGALARRILEGAESLQLTDAVRSLLSDCAQEVGISPADAADALRNVSTATTLLREINKRMTDGNERLMEAVLVSGRLRDAGDLAGARKPMEDVLTVKVVPFYREQAEMTLRRLTRLEGVARTGHVDGESHPWQQLRILGYRAQQGRALELCDDMRDFLRRTAPAVAISEEEAGKALTTQEGAEALLARMLERIREGRYRISSALSRVVELDDAGRIEEARQQLRDVLAVEVVPLYRKMAEENLAKLDEAAPDR